MRMQVSTERQRKCVRTGPKLWQNIRIRYLEYRRRVSGVDRELTSILQILFIGFPTVLAGIVEHLFYTASFESFLETIR